jgi:hypothetical protein
MNYLKLHANLRITGKPHQSISQHPKTLLDSGDSKV